MPVELSQLHRPGMPGAFPPLRTGAFTTSAVMALVAADWVGSSRHLQSIDDDGLVDFQRSLVNGLRERTDRFDGRHLSLPSATRPPRGVRGPPAPPSPLPPPSTLGPFRIGVAVGLVEDLGGELAGRTVLAAYGLMRGAGAGQHPPPPRHRSHLRTNDSPMT